MMASTFLLLAGVCSANSAQNQTQTMPVRVPAPWTVEVGPGSVTAADKEIRLGEAVRLSISPPARVEIHDECYADVPRFNPEQGGWRKGARLRGLITEECTATGALHPATLRLKAAPGNSPAFDLDADYSLDPFWGTFGTLEGGKIAANQTLYVDYAYDLSRLDSVVVDGSGTARIVAGQPGLGSVLPPTLGLGEISIANIWVPSGTQQLSEENLYPIEFGDPMKPGPTESVAERLLPRTLAKLRAGDEVTIVAWGDSVTHGGGVGAQVQLWYQNQFADRLRARFPKARVRMLTAGWPGAGSKQYLEAPAGGTYDFGRDVLLPKPDLVTIEFVNDAYLDEGGTQTHYGEILRRLTEVGAEVILITPHLVRPDWMKVSTLKFDDDPRPYVKGLRNFAAANNVALADASKDWCQLWRRGIPYVTLEANSINHPDARGHAIFADALMGLFPAE
ncbi:MAG: hypothetical protein HY706_02535 [Candidatus Hydrogenedentes bacterium]|nr:hypothetical protein [Candidatus Hydrogenedentota bacterium]